MFDLISLSKKNSAKFGLAVTMIVALGACAHNPPAPEWTGTPIEDTEIPPTTNVESVEPEAPKPAPRVKRAQVPAARTGAQHIHKSKKHLANLQARHHAKRKLNKGDKIAKAAKARAIQPQAVASVGDSLPPSPPMPPAPPAAAPAFEPSPIVNESAGGLNWLYVVGGMTTLGALGWVVFRNQKSRRLIFNS